MQYDLITIGEPLLRMSPPRYVQLRRTDTLDVFVVGSQLNVAANFARLGKQAAFLTRLPDNPLGLMALDACRSYGLDVSHIKMVPGAKMGVTYVEFSIAPRAPVAVYDRAGSAAGTTSPDDFDWDSLLASTKFAYTDGIFPGLGPSCSEATAAFFDAAKRHGCTCCFDVNYREHLWTPDAARASWSKILPKIDILVTNRGVSEAVFGRPESDSDEDMMRFYAETFGCRVVCLTSREIMGTESGAWNSMALTSDGIIHGRRTEFDIVDRYGTGDAWFAGFLYGFAEKGPAYGLDFGNAMCALAHTIEGDVAHLTPSDVEAIMVDKIDLRVRR
ncbi:MAG: PfkB family carbohydrate kinase [Armatimonadota bacterium]